MKILIVDDDKAMVKLLAACVEYCGHETVTAGHGEEALARYEADAPDAVFMDIIMPVMDGIEASRRILERDPRARIVFVTGIGDYPENIPENIRRKVSILTKPVTIQAILDLLESPVLRERLQAMPSPR